MHLINLSTAWEPPDPEAGRTAWTRRFGLPAGIEPGDRVWLVAEPALSCAATLGGEPLPSLVAGQAWRQEVTARLRSRNELRLLPAVRLPHEAARRQPLPARIGSVRLELESGGAARG